MNSEMQAPALIQSRHIDIDGSKIHYLEAGKGDPIVFFHGVPTSSFLWRKIIPHLSPLGRCIAPDLIGFGQSDKPDIAYTIEDHVHYMEKFLEALSLKNITFVLHGWGSLIGFDIATRFPEKCKGLVFYEAYIKPIQGNDISLPYREQIFTLQQEINNAHSINQNGQFVDQIMSQALIHPLAPEVMAEYHRPFGANASAKPLFQYLQEVSGHAGNLNQFIANYSQKLIKSSFPKLLLYAMPGFITTVSTILWAKEHFSNLEIIEVGEAMHYAQETSSELMGEAISVWMQAIEQQLTK